MKGILAALILFTACAQAEPGYYVIGDSQCEAVMKYDEIQQKWTGGGDASLSWPHKIQTFTGMYMKNACRSGQLVASGAVYNTIVALDIVPNGSIRGIIVHLGTNDKVRTEIYGAPLDFGEELSRGVQEALSRGLEVICILPPDNFWFTTEDVRAIVSANCPVTIDGSAIVGPADMPDGSHFGPEGHRAYAEGIMEGL